MGLLDLFKKKESGPGSSKGDRDLARLEKLVSSKFSQNLDRQDALDRLSQMGTAAAAAALLKRFTWTLDPTITDQEEKAVVVTGLVKAGKEALDPIRRYCARAESVTWPLKAVRQILTGDELLQELLTLLDQFDTDYVRNPEPKVQLLQALGEHPSEDVRIAAEPFITDANEAVRFAAVTTVFAVEDPRSVPSLIAGLAEEESLRIKNRIAGGLAERGWEIPEELRASCTSALPPGYRLDGGVIRG